MTSRKSSDNKIPKGKVGKQTTKSSSIVDVSPEAALWHMCFNPPPGGTDRAALEAFLAQHQIDLETPPLPKGTMRVPTTYLCAASCKRNVVAVEVLLAHGADPNASPPAHRGNVPLVIAREAECCAALIAGGANVNAQTKNGHTALHSAAGLGDAEMTALLLYHGADVTLRGKHYTDKSAMTALEYIEEKKTANPDVLKLLRDAANGVRPPLPSRLRSGHTTTTTNNIRESAAAAAETESATTRRGPTGKSTSKEAHEETTGGAAAVRGRAAGRATSGGAKNDRATSNGRRAARKRKARDDDADEEDKGDGNEGEPVPIEAAQPAKRARRGGK